MKPDERRYCRCILEQHAQELKRYGKTKSNAYAICAASVGRAGYQLRSRFVAIARAGKCTKNLRFTKLPTEILYSYAKLRETTAKGRKIFVDLPSPATFFKNPESYRADLLSKAGKYKRLESKI